MLRCAREWLPLLRYLNGSTNKKNITMKTFDESSVWLSPHFRLSEFTLSGTALRLCIDNTPSAEVVKRLEALCVHVLEPLRRRVGCVRVTSGYRCARLNAAVGGVARSQHLLGEAADLYVSSREMAEKWAAVLRQTPFDQLVFEPIGSKHCRWLHVSYTTRHAPRGRVIS